MSISSYMLLHNYSSCIVCFAYKKIRISTRARLIIPKFRFFITLSLAENIENNAFFPFVMWPFVCLKSRSISISDHKRSNLIL